MISVPFPGNKRYAYGRVREIFASGGYGSVYEPFGGSGVLSVNLVRDGLVRGEAVINDYDGLWTRYGEYLDAKDRIVGFCYGAGVEKRSKNGPKGLIYRISGGRKLEVDTLRLSGWETRILQGAVEKEDRGLWWLLHLGNNFTFPRMLGRPVVLGDFKYFQNQLGTERQREYLGLVGRCRVTRLDWECFLEENASGMDGDSLVILDPPYYGTLQSQYKGFFTFGDTVRMLGAFGRLGCDLLFFNSPGLMPVLLDEAGLLAKVERVGNHAMTMDKGRYDSMAFIPGDR